MSFRTYTRITRIIRQDGAQFGFTELDRDLTIAGLVYKASSATDPETTKRTIDLGTDKLKVRSILSDDGITEGDIVGGLFAQAKVVIARVDYTNLPASILLAPYILLSGTVGEIITTNSTYTLEVRNLIATLNQNITVKASPSCRNRFGDSACFNIDSATTEFITFTGTVTEAANSISFNTGFVPGISLGYGSVEFTSGKNKGIIATIEEHEPNTNNYKLLRSLPFTPQPGDSLIMRNGCAKNVEACKVYGNFINFGGFPPPVNEDSGFMPGTDHIIASPLE